MTSCPSDEKLARFLHHQLPEQERAEVTEHLESCPVCREIVAQATPSGPALADSDSDDSNRVGTRIGRYEILSILGSGGMGTVFLAHDSQLDRKIALKLLHAGGVDGAERKRLLREARTLARLQHPNVVTALDVGEDQGRVYLTMEYVEGCTLRQWLQRQQRTTAEILRVFGEIARGLQAAHQAGVIHRDLKPDNILVDLEGRPKIADFGIAKQSKLPASSETRPCEDLAAPASAKTSVLAGTPAYMAPEQCTAQQASPLSDQFAYCITLWEALYGQRPARSSETVPAQTIASRRVPRSVRLVLARGLNADPNARFPSMAALAAALHAPSRRSRVLWAALAITLLIVVSLSFRLLRRDSGPKAPCSAQEKELDAVWSKPLRAEVEKALTEARAPKDVRQRILANLDAYAAEWVNASRDACEATSVRKTQPEGLYLLRSRCLDARRQEFAALVHSLRSVAPESVPRLVEATLKLPSLAVCADTGSLTAPGPAAPDPHLAPQVELLRTRLREGRAAYATGKFVEASEIAEESVVKARSLDYRPVLAEALLLSATTSSGQQSRTALLEAAWNAEASHHDLVAAQAWVALAQQASDLGDQAKEQEWSQRATSSVERLTGEKETKSRLLSELALERLSNADAAGAQSLASKALSLRASTPKQETLQDLIDLLTRAASLRRLGQPQAATQDLERAEEISTRLLGRSTPNLEYQRAAVLADSGSFEPALTRLAKAWALLEEVSPPPTSKVEREGDDASWDQIFQLFKDIQSILSTQSAVLSLKISILVLRGETYLAKGESRKARDAFLQAQRLDSRESGESAFGIVPRTHLARLAREENRLEEALSEASQASGLADRLLRPTDPRRLAARVEFAQALAATGKRSEALPMLKQIEPADSWPASLRVAHALALLRIHLEEGAPKETLSELVSSIDVALSTQGRLADPERRRFAQLRGQTLREKKP